MRIVIDLQAAQGCNEKRGIGRYSIALAKAMVRNRGENEILIALNGLFPETIEPIRAEFDTLLPQKNIRIWHSVAPVNYRDRGNDWRRHSAEVLREAFLASLKPDIVHITSIFEGFVDNAITSVSAFCKLPTAVTLYDLIPLIYSQSYLADPILEAWYLQKLDHLRRADIWLAISESSRQEGYKYLDLPEDRVVNISTAADAIFVKTSISVAYELEIRQKYGVLKQFVMYTGGIDERKNIEGLIRSFSLLPSEVRCEHQLVIVCSIRPDDRFRLLNLAKSSGLSVNEVIFTGFVPEEDLVTLYNLCKLFVFPSWHEGFGLPALEAMRCGAPVIGANTSSLPEVIGWDEALFDPRSDATIASAMERALCDEVFRTKLIRHGELQAEKFSWDDSARQAIVACEHFYSKNKSGQNVISPLIRRPKLAYVSPLPPARSGIADYSAELLPELARHYEIDVVVAQNEVSNIPAKAYCSVQTVAWFLEHADRYDRVLYQFGNSDHHGHMFDLLATIPGVVVLHDFFLSGIVAHLDSHGFKPGCFAKELYHAHGYHAAKTYLRAEYAADAIWKYPCNLSVLQGSLGTIVHSKSSLRLAQQWYDGFDQDNWDVIPLLRQPGLNQDRSKARATLGFNDDDFIVCSFGIMGPSKLNHRLLDAFLDSKLRTSGNCYLIFVGENHPAEYGQQILLKIKDNKKNGNIRITGWTDTDVFRQYLLAADVGVQLRTLSRGETSAAVLDCMNYGLATIVNANGSMADLPDDGVCKLSDDFTDEQLTEALEWLWEDSAKRIELGAVAKEIIRKTHSPRKCADMYCSAVEKFYLTAATGIQALPATIADVDLLSSDSDLVELAKAITKTIPKKFGGKQLLVDVSELVQRDGKSGIQRVVRNILLEWIINPPDSYRVEPIYATKNVAGYRYARHFTLGFLGCPENMLDDDVVEFSSGDIFLGLDFQPHVVSAQQLFYQEMRREGVNVKFVIYDLLPILLPSTFVEGAADGHATWLRTVAQSDGAICISQSVADELQIWLRKNPVQRSRPFSIEWFHLGADIDNSCPSKGHPDDAKDFLALLRSKPTFLCVGTIEPRKCQALILSAFELLWQADSDIIVVFVGKQGWMMETLINKLRNHAELSKRLFWLEGISDEYLKDIYAVSTCLIAASEGEGFGLPLIEAAQHKTPIIARDIPVFREVANENAFYFSGEEPEELASSVNEWLGLYAADEHPKSDAMHWLTWEQSARNLWEQVSHVQLGPVGAK